MDLEMLLFNIDLNSSKSGILLDQSSLPCAPPPSPDFSSRRKPITSPLPITKLFECCEDLILQTNKMNINVARNSLHTKRKTSDCEEFSPSPNSSPINTNMQSGVDKKRSRSSFDFDNFPEFQEKDFTISAISISTQS